MTYGHAHPQYILLGTPSLAPQLVPTERSAGIQSFLSWPQLNDLSAV